MHGCLLAFLIALAATPVCSGIVATIAVPALARYTRRARAAEAHERLSYLFRAMASHHAQYGQLPQSAPLTPTPVAAGARVLDAPGTGSHPSWQALSFSITEPHYYSYLVLTDGRRFTLRAVGDLDGDGVTSTFERVGVVTPAGVAGSGGVQTVREDE